jgi:hypothetical protein
LNVSSRYIFYQLPKMTISLKWLAWWNVGTYAKYACTIASGGLASGNGKMVLFTVIPA